MADTASFCFMRGYGQNLEALPALAESHFRTDPSTSLIKLRQFAELLVKKVAARHGLYKRERRDSFEAIHFRRSYERVLLRESVDLFHGFRKLGNDSALEVKGTHAEALSGLKFPPQTAVWFHRTYGRQLDPKPGLSLPPPPPIDASATPREEIAALRLSLAKSEGAAEAAGLLAGQEARARDGLSECLRRESEDWAVWEALTNEGEIEKADLVSRLAALQAQAEKTRVAALQAFVTSGEKTTEKINLDEADTRPGTNRPPATRQRLGSRHSTTTLRRGYPARQSPQPRRRRMARRQRARRIRARRRSYSGWCGRGLLS